MSNPQLVGMIAGSFLCETTRPQFYEMLSSRNPDRVMIILRERSPGNIWTPTLLMFKWSECAINAASQARLFFITSMDGRPPFTRETADDYYHSLLLSLREAGDRQMTAKVAELTAIIRDTTVLYLETMTPNTPRAVWPNVIIVDVDHVENKEQTLMFRLGLD